MTTKCYIVDYDKKINNYRNILNKMNRQEDSLYYDIYKQDNFIEKYNKQLNDQYVLNQYMNNINDYLDELLESPGMTDEDIYNLKKDQEDIIKSIDDIGQSISTLESKCKGKKDIENTNSKVEDKEKTKQSNTNSSIDVPNITININNGEKKTTFYPGRKIDPQKIKF